MSTHEERNSGSEARAMRERLLRGTVNTAALAALLLIIAAFVGPAERALQAAGWGEFARAAPTASSSSQAAEGRRIVIPLPRPKRFQAAPENRESIPYAWSVDSGDVYRDSAEGAGATPAEPARSTPETRQAPSADETPTTVYGHGGW